MAQARSSLNILATLLVMPATAALSQDVEQPVPSEHPVFVQTMVLPAENEVVTRQFFGQIAALETVDISFEVGGYLNFLEAREGTTISEGTPLGRLDLAPFERAVERAELTLAQAERELGRALTLAERNAASAVQAENAETARDLADVALREAREALADAQIQAPFDALVADRLGTTFTTIEPGQPVLRLHDMTEIRVEFDLPERLLAAIGDPSEVAFTGQIGGSGAEIPLSFREFRAEASGIGQSYAVSLALVAEVDALLLPGRTITVFAQIARPQSGIQIPATAIVTQPDGSHTVAVVHESGDDITADHVAVDVSSANGTSFTVFGLSPAAEIISVGAHLIDDGQRIERFEGLTIEGS
ncbi:efflux RND transporter periplasmic adaptor subunit [Gymnodinialimonas sp. 2305UL16-5]|uniref:efflux RND transporter periplasmic adaptor subunit n=1 Tax=Gymnodinialimonas mytili TaxID=3126503 RepID=UPI0030AFCC38